MHRDPCGAHSVIVDQLTVPCFLFFFFLFFFRRTALEAVATQQGPRLPSLKDFRWRVDVAISTRYTILCSLSHWRVNFLKEKLNRELNWENIMRTENVHEMHAVLSLYSSTINGLINGKHISLLCSENLKSKQNCLEGSDFNNTCITLSVIFLEAP